MADRLYHFRFQDVKEPITIKAGSSAAAREIIKARNLPPQYSNKAIVGETTSNLLIGISHLIINGKKAIWNGQEFKIPA